MSAIIPDDIFKPLTLSDLQLEVQNGWTGELYSAEFKERACPYKDFDHAIKHVQKAVGKLQNMVEEADHGGDALQRQVEIGKYIADIVISAARLANVTPSGQIHLNAAVRLRVPEKITPKGGA